MLERHVPQSLPIVQEHHPDFLQTHFGHLHHHKHLRSQVRHRRETRSIRPHHNDHPLHRVHQRWSKIQMDHKSRHLKEWRISPHHIFHFFIQFMTSQLESSNFYHHSPDAMVSPMALWMAGRRLPIHCISHLGYRSHFYRSSSPLHHRSLRLKEYKIHRRRISPSALQFRCGRANLSLSFLPLIINYKMYLAC